MSVIVKDMEFPQGCEFCDLSYTDEEDRDYYCGRTNEKVTGFFTERPDNCPLEKIPQKEG